MALLVILTFLSAFLLFQIELIIAKLFLPNYGGSFLVWGACIVFFQAVLLAGYIFAHTFLQRLGAWRYLRLHLWLLLAPLLFFPLRDVHLSFARPALPLVFDIFARLTVTIGPVFFTLSTMSLVTQSWLAASFLKGRLNPYRLYAVSNLGSFMALLTYPFFFELFLTDTQQLQIWRILYLVLAFVSILAFRVVKIDHSRLQQKTAVEAQPVALDKILRWLGLGAAGVVMFLSVTNMVTYEVAPVPLLWVLPLGIYLMAFVLNFKQNPWCPSWLIRWIGPIIGLQTMLYFLAQRHWLPVVLMIILLSLLLWCTCMYIQHQLVLAKPTAERMTFFYVMISLGGFLGGMLTTWIIPVISDTLTEYLVGLFLLAFLLPPRQKPVFWPSALWFSTATLAFFVWPYFVRGYHLWSFALLVAAVCFSFAGMARDNRWMAVFFAGIIMTTPFLESLWQDVHFIVKKRNYYGIYEVYDSKHNLRVLLHGTTLHGLEFVAKDKRCIPLGYYSPISPIGSLLIDDVFRARRVGVVGLGTGTLSMYAKPSCPIDYYELDGDVKTIASRDFWYLAEAPGKVKIILGDARLSLQKAADRTYDLLVIDAFSVDAIPTHLINKDVLVEYRRKLTGRGAVVFHITNRYLNLEPVLARIADVSGAYVAYKDVGDQGYNMRSIWCILTWDDNRFLKLITREGWQPLEIDPKHEVRAWSDHYSTILPVINMNEMAVSLKSFKPFTL